MQDLFWFVLPLVLTFAFTGKRSEEVSTARTFTLRSSFDGTPTPCR